MTLALTVLAGVHAQSVQIRIKAKESEIPVEVIESFRKDFSGNTAEVWEIVPATLVEEGYVVSGYDDLNGAKLTSYSVTLKGTNFKSEAIYDQNGEMKFFKETIKDTALPVAIVNAVTSKFPGYRILKDQETIKSGKKTLIHYRVVIEKGKEKKALAVDSTGKILKERKLM